MGTLFTDSDTGAEVAHRSWGGDSVGVRVTLLPGARNASMDSLLRGDDGSTETLRSLAEQTLDPLDAPRSAFPCYGGRHEWRHSPRARGTVCARCHLPSHSSPLGGGRFRA